MASDNKQIKVKITLDGVQEFKTQLKDVSKAADQLGKDFKNLGSALADSAKRFAVLGAAAAGVAAGILKLVKSNDDFAESIQNTSKQTGVSVQNLQVMQKAAEFTGVSSEGLNKGLVRLTKGLNDLRDPASTLNKNITDLDASLGTQLRTASSTEDAYNILRTSLAGMNDEAKVAEIAQLAFGKAGLDLIPVLTQTSEEYAKQSDMIRKYGIQLNQEQIDLSNQVGDAFDKSNLAIEGTARLLGAALTPAVDAALTAFADLVVQNRQQFADFIAFIANDAAKIIRDFFTLLSNGPEVQGVDERARTLYNGFVTFKDAVVGAFNTVKPILDGFLSVLNLIAAAIGMGSGTQLGLTLAFLQFTGVFNVAIAAIKVGLSSFNLLTAAIKLAPIALTSMSAAFLKAGPIITSVITSIRTTFLAATLAMQISVGVLTSVLGGLRIAFTAVWLAVTGPIGIAIAAIVAVGAAIALVIDKTIGWEKAIEIVKTFFTNLGTTALQVLSSIGSAIVGIAIQLKDAFAGVLSYVATTVIQGIVKAFQGISSLIGPAIKSALDSLKGLFDAIVSGISNAIKRAFDALKAQVLSVFDGIKNAFQSAIQAIQNTINSVKSAVSSVVGGSQTRTQQSSPTAKTIKFADGGKVSGPGTGTSDSILARLSNGEYVVKASAVRKYGKGFMDAINSGVFNLKAFATGGIVDTVNSFAGINGPTLQPALAGGIDYSSPSTSVGRPLNLYLPNGKVIPTRVDVEVGKMLEKEMRSSDMAKAMQSPRWNR